MTKYLNSSEVLAFLREQRRKERGEGEATTRPAGDDGAGQGLPENVELEHLGGGYYRVNVAGQYLQEEGADEPAKIRGKAAALAAYQAFADATAAAEQERTDALAAYATELQKPVEELTDEEREVALAAAGDTGGDGDEE